MPSAGGPAALHGFLYQLLVHLDDVARCAVNPVDADTATLEFEPVGGGDAQLHFPAKRIVQQIKTRANAKTWSLKEVVEGPVTDFVRAVQRLKTANDEFHFISDGRTWHLIEFARFLERICQSAADLRDRTVRRYAGVGDVSDADLVAWIRKRVHCQLKSEDPPSQADILHVLARLKLNPPLAEEVLTSNVLGLLKRCLPNPDDAASKLTQMVGSLISSLSRGVLELACRWNLINAGDQRVAVVLSKYRNGSQRDCRIYLGGVRCSGSSLQG